jgi:hypothetical protein
VWVLSGRAGGRAGGGQTIMLLTVPWFLAIVRARPGRLSAISIP